MTKTDATRDRIIDKLQSGIDAVEYERILGMEALTGGEDNIMFECDVQQSMILAVMSTICYPTKPDGSIDTIIAYDEPVIANFMKHFKYNMISNKRKGRMELVKVMRGEEEDESFTSRIKDAISGGD